MNENSPLKRAILDYVPIDVLSVAFITKNQKLARMLLTER
jgi:hypothetical protein